MQFVIYCLDQPNAAQIRATNRPAHIEYLKGFTKSIVVAGPLLAEDGAGMIGSLLVMDFADRAEAERFSQNDPFRKAGLFQSIAITPWRKTLP